MDPIIATGLINIGSNIVNKAFSKSAELNPSPAVNFKDDLDKFTHKPTAILKDLNQIREDILSFPEVQNFISKNEGNVISIDKMSDGSMRFLSSNGDFMTLPSNHPSSAFTVNFLDSSLASGKNLNAQRPNSVILIG